MDERMRRHRESADPRAEPGIGAAFHIPVVWLVFYLVLLVHGMTSRDRAATAVQSAGQTSILLSADRREAASAVPGR